MMEITEKEGAREHVSIEGILLAFGVIMTSKDMRTPSKIRIAKLNFAIRYVLSESKVNDGHLVGVFVQH